MSNTRDHRRFVERDGWQQFKKGADHTWYRKQNADGTWKRTKISHGYKEYGNGLFNLILKTQLQVTRQEFDDTI